jgi:hypothetical protein
MTHTTGMFNFCSCSIFVKSSTINTQNVLLASGFIAIVNNPCGCGNATNLTAVTSEYATEEVLSGTCTSVLTL